MLKDHYQHKRPLLVADGNLCVSHQGKAALEKIPDYPSGHTTLGWETGLIFAELDPQAVTDVLARARAFGQSRDLDAARTELAALRVGAKSEPARCDAEAETLSKSPY